MNGYFHLESSLQPELGPFSQEDAQRHFEWMRALAIICDLEMIFWQFHSTGFGLLLRTDKSYSYSNKARGKALATLDQSRLSLHCIEPKKHALLPSDLKHWQHYENARGQVYYFIKSFKQRISCHYNQNHQRTGRIWQDRSKIFLVPNTINDLQEVTAYILARPEIETGIDHSSWPSIFNVIAMDDPLAANGLEHLAKNKRSPQNLIQKLRDQQKDILLKAKTRKPKQQKGRSPEWRPDCESGERKNAAVQPPAEKSYQVRRQNERRHFLNMLKRFKNFQKKTGLEQIPWGYPEDLQLRTWGAQIRGRYHSNRLSGWQLEALKDSPLLQAVCSTSPNSKPIPASDQ